MAAPRIAKDDAAGWRKEALRLRKALKELTKNVGIVIAALDGAMEMPESTARGKRIAHAANAIEFARDHARHFGLGEKLAKAPARRRS